MSQTNEKEWLAERFEENRRHLRAIAYRMLGSFGEAEDAVQETWLRLNRSDARAVENLTAWLTTVVSRICLDVLRVRRMRGEIDLNVETSEHTKKIRAKNDPEQELLLADSVGIALLVILETLTPAERLAFVLHDSFGVSFDEIARITGRTPVAARQLASRARRRVCGKNSIQNSDQIRQRKLVEAFFAAARGGDFERLLAILDPDVVLRTDRETVSSDVSTEIRGAMTVAKRALGASRAKFSEVAMVDGKAAIIVAPGGRLRRAMLFTISQNKIAKIDVVAAVERLRAFKVAPLAD